MFEKLTAVLKENGFAVSAFEAKEAAAQYLNSVLDGQVIGFGGSVTLEQMNLFDSLSSHNDVRWHQRRPEGMTDAESRIAANSADIYISSVNGIAETGEIINIDNNCNRVAAIFYGHKKVYLIVGANKIAPDYDSALWRAPQHRIPLNAQRLHRKTPCAAKGDRCYDCKSPERICRGLSVLWKKPASGEFEVILINETLGY